MLFPPFAQYLTITIAEADRGPASPASLMKIGLAEGEKRDLVSFLLSLTPRLGRADLFEAPRSL